MRTCPICKKEKRNHKDGLSACSKQCETRKLTREAIAKLKDKRSKNASIYPAPAE